MRKIALVVVSLMADIIIGYFYRDYSIQKDTCQERIIPIEERSKTGIIVFTIKISQRGRCGWMN